MKFCTECDYQTPNKYRMKQHVYDRHTPFEDQQHYPCPDCEYIAIRKGSLIKHRFNIHSNQPLKCPMCDYTCTNKYYMTIHTKTHFTLYVCTKCRLEFQTKKELLKHVTSCIKT